MADPKEPSDLENTLEDALGFNFRSLRTLRDILLRPNKVFKSYAAGDRITYTPALRIWLGLMSLQFVVLALNGGYRKIFLAQLDNNPEQFAEINELVDGQVEILLESAGTAMGYLQVPIMGLFSALSIFVLKGIEPTLKFSARLNIAFAILSAGSTIGLLSALGGLGNPIVGLIGMLGIFVMYYATFLRGGPGVLDQTSKGLQLKAFGYSTALFVLVIVAAILLGLLSGIYAGFMAAAAADVASPLAEPT